MKLARATDLLSFVHLLCMCICVELEARCSERTARSLLSYLLTVACEGTLRLYYPLVRAVCKIRVFVWCASLYYF